jgi:hypothetical protein
VQTKENGCLVHDPWNDMLRNPRLNFPGDIFVLCIYICTIRIELRMLGGTFHGLLIESHVSFGIIQKGSSSIGYVTEGIPETRPTLGHK